MKEDEDESSSGLMGRKCFDTLNCSFAPFFPTDSDDNETLRKDPKRFIKTVLFFLYVNKLPSKRPLDQL